MTLLELLKTARELIAKPEAWTKRVFRGRRLHGSAFPVHETDQADCFCAEGALQEAAGPTNYGLRLLAERAICDAVNEPRWLWCFNDRPQTTHEDVLKAFDIAIAVAQ